MASKEPIVHSLINLDHIGGLASKKRTDSGRIKLTIRPLSKNPLPNRTKELPYKLDEKEDIIKMHSNAHGDVWLLVPRSPPPSVDVEKTPYHEIADNLEKVKELQEQKQELKKKIGKLKKQKKGDDEDSSSSGSSGVKCPECGEKFKKAVWKQNRGVCVNCRSVNDRFATGAGGGVGPRSGRGRP